MAEEVFRQTRYSAMSMEQQAAYSERIADLLVGSDDEEEDPFDTDNDDDSEYVPHNDDDVASDVEVEAIIEEDLDEDDDDEEAEQMPAAPTEQPFYAAKDEIKWMKKYLSQAGQDPIIFLLLSDTAHLIFSFKAPLRYSSNILRRR